MIHTRNLKCFVLDTKNDLYEEEIHYPFSNNSSINEYLSAFEKMIQLERSYVSHYYITDNKTNPEMVEIRKELEKLGYLD